MAWVSFLWFWKKKPNYSKEDRKRLNQLYKMRHSYERKIKKVDEEINLIKEFYK